MKSINQLKSSDHAVIEKLIKVSTGETQSVDYSTTVFENQDGYSRMMNLVGETIIGSQIKNLVETPLIAERGNLNRTYFSAPNKGVGFGYIFIHYTKRNPLLALIVDKDETGYTYSSCKYDDVTGSWQDYSTATTSAESVNELVQFVISNLSNDVINF